MVGHANQDNDSITPSSRSFENISDPDSHIHQMIDLKAVDTIGNYSK